MKKYTPLNHAFTVDGDRGPWVNIQDEIVRADSLLKPSIKMAFERIWYALHTDLNLKIKRHIKGNYRD